MNPAAPIVPIPVGLAAPVRSSVSSQKTARRRPPSPGRAQGPGTRRTRPCPDFPLLPYDLTRAPELASLALVEEALHISVLSLVAAHPTLQNDPSADEAFSVRRARRLITAVGTLQISLSRYRDAVYSVLCPPPPPLDDLSF
jgi:hypothetical protein